MQVIHYKEGGGAPECLVWQERDIPAPGPHDLLVQIKACSVNPVDTKIREGKFPASDITGYDASGIVTAVGAQVVTFAPGDAVFYAGVLGRAGTTAQYNLIDARLAARAPTTLSFDEAAAFPLVSLTAWELLMDHFGLVPYAATTTLADKRNPDAILIINGAGGVGSIATQLARRVFNLKHVIVTASRDASTAHATAMGATHVLTHHAPLLPQLREAGIAECKYVMICHSTAHYLEQACEIASCWGKIGSIVETDAPLAFHSMHAFSKSLSFHWEFMLAKGSAGVMLESQGRILKQIAKLLDAKVLSSIRMRTMPLTVANLRAAHSTLESGRAIGKIVLTVGSDLK